MATATPANGARTRSPAASCGTHCTVLDMKPNDRTIVHSRPEARTVSSDSIMYRETVLLFDPKNSAASTRQRILEVVAHEMAHIRNYDIRLMMMLAVLVGLVVMLCDLFWQMMWFAPAGRRPAWVC